MSDKKTYRYEMKEWMRESISEFLGSFLQLYLLLVSLMMHFTAPNVAVRMYTDPQYCYTLSNSSEYECLKAHESSDHLNKTEGKVEGDLIYNIQLDAIFILVIAVNWVSGMLLGLMLTVPVSAGYLNPAISVTLATMSRLQWKKLLHYIPSQYLGAFFAALFFDVLYYKHMYEDTSIGEKWPNKRKDIILYVLTSTPHPKINMWTAIMDSLFASAVFSFFLFAILDRRVKEPVPKWAQPLLLVFVLFGVILGFYADTKLQLSPARDFGTRLYAAFAVGFEPAFSSFSYCFWWLPKQICLYAGFLGGGWLYVVLLAADEKTLQNMEQNGSDNKVDKRETLNETNDNNLKQISNPENKIQLQ